MWPTRICYLFAIFAEQVLDELCVFWCVVAQDGFLTFAIVSGFGAPDGRLAFDGEVGRETGVVHGRSGAHRRG